MIKIAVASDGGNVTGHFGHCEAFRIYTCDQQTVLEEEILPNPGHKPGFLPNLLADHGVGVIICGGMGAGAREGFGTRGVQIITGAAGDARAAAEAFLKGELVSTDTVCHRHQHAGECGGHHHCGGHTH